MLDYLLNPKYRRITRRHNISYGQRVAANQPPTDQLPLAAMLDILDIRTVNLGEWMNWPVSKNIGGAPAVIPRQVVGAHGGFPLTEWQKYLQSPDHPLLFKPDDYTRKVRYLTDSEKNLI